MDKNYRTAFNSSSFLAKMGRIMQEVDEKSGLLQGKPRIGRFLDVGAAPGGFSHYFLNSRPGSLGVGINLPRERGGHIFAASVEESRYQLHHQDLTDGEFFARHPLINENPGLFDLVVLDCLYLDNKEWNLPEESEAGMKLTKGKFHENHSLGEDVLLATQLFLALHNLSSNGSLIARLTSQGHSKSNLILMGLRNLFKSVVVVKPTICHSVRSSCYVVFDGFLVNQNDSDPLYEQFLAMKERLHAWLVKAHAFASDLLLDFKEIFLGVNGSLEVVLNDEVADFIIKTFGTAWRTQLDAINGALLRFRERKTYGPPSKFKWNAESNRQ
jgi:23S rRNA U2552 (ribose-2'-O)-methylase RlmE/FtsJ